VQWIVFIAATWGSYALRWNVLFGGEAINRSGAGYYTYRPTFEFLWYSIVSVVLLLGILAALLAAMPRDIQFDNLTENKKA
jgi:hypothetical protein